MAAMQAKIDWFFTAEYLQNWTQKSYPNTKNLLFVAKAWLRYDLVKKCSNIFLKYALWLHAKLQIFANLEKRRKNYLTRWVMVSGVQIYPYMGDYLEISIDIHLISKAFGFRLDGLYIFSVLPQSKALFLRPCFSYILARKVIILFLSFCSHI